MNKQIPVDTWTDPIDTAQGFWVKKYLNALGRQGRSEYYWQIYLGQVHYFSNIFKLTGHEDIERWNSWIMMKCFEAGRIGIWKNSNGKLVPVQILVANTDINNEIKNVEAISINTTTFDPTEYKTVRLRGDEVAILNWNTNAYPALFFWDQGIQMLVHLLKIFRTNSIQNIKKFKFSIPRNMSPEQMRELASFTNPDDPYIIHIINNMDESTKAKDLMSVSKLEELKSYGVNLDTFKDITDFLGFIYLHLGRRFNTNKKKDHNLNDEIAKENETFEILENETIKNLEIGIKDMNKKFGINVKLEKVIQPKMDEQKESDASDQRDQVRTSN